MNTVKFALVVCLPHIETFGYLIVASYSSVIFGAICFVSYVLRSRNRKAKVPYAKLCWSDWVNSQNIKMNRNWIFHCKRHLDDYIISLLIIASSVKFYLYESHKTNFQFSWNHKIDNTYLFLDGTFWKSLMHHWKNITKLQK